MQLVAWISERHRRCLNWKIEIRARHISRTRSWWGHNVQLCHRGRKGTASLISNLIVGLKDSLQQRWSLWLGSGVRLTASKPLQVFNVFQVFQVFQESSSPPKYRNYNTLALYMMFTLVTWRLHFFHDAFTPYMTLSPLAWHCNPLHDAATPYMTLTPLSWRLYPIHDAYTPYMTLITLPTLTWRCHISWRPWLLKSLSIMQDNNITFNQPIKNEVNSFMDFVTVINSYKLYCICMSLKYSINL